jgi:HlyD family secretion protein
MSSTEPANPANPITSALSSAPVGPMPKAVVRPRRRWVGWALATLLIAAGVVAWLMLRPARPAPAEDPARWITQPVDSGTLRRMVNATGPLSPVNLVQVGAAVSGTIRALHVDFNSPVKAGQLLAELDTTALDADLAQARAQLAGAQAALAQARMRLKRSEELLAQGFVSDADRDDKRAALQASEATLAQMQALVDRAADTRKRAEIRSPVAGVVVSREVAVGQTVAASLQTPVLFRIAQDLRDVQIDMNVSEADVGQMHEGQAVQFMVDAYPERRFEGRVHQVRNNHQVLQNVVTYTVVVRARNDELLLRPGMTAYVAVQVAERSGVLRIPNAALRYTPAGQDAAASAAERGSQRQVWRVGAGGRPEAQTVTLGITDGRFTELAAGSLKAGDALITGERGAAGFSGPRIF